MAAPIGEMVNVTTENQRFSGDVAIVGLGYVGSVSAACLADLGRTVVGVDLDPYKVKCLNEGRAPFHEPELDELIARHTSAGRLRATTSLSEGLAGASIALICVGTPSAENGNLSFEQLHRVAEQIAAHLETRETPLIVAIRSTVWPGTCENLYENFFGRSPKVQVVSHPEFLREGTAVRDFYDPSLIVVGGDNAEAVEAVARLYEKLEAKAALVSLRTAEAIKYSCNAFHALKIAFANEIAAVCDALDVPGEEVMSTLVLDTRLNISKAYLRPGFAFGGSCLPKDLRALTYSAARLDVDLPVLNHVLASNHAHLDRAIRRVLKQHGKKIAVYGLSFKEDTDDVRESPVVLMLEQLIGKGCDLSVFDPYIKLEEIYGANQRYLLNTVPHIGRLMRPSFPEWLQEAEVIVITQKLRPEHAEAVRGSGKEIIDVTRPRYAKV